MDSTGKEKVGVFFLPNDFFLVRRWNLLLTSSAIALLENSLLLSPQLCIHCKQSVRGEGLFFPFHFTGLW